jgi:hypothetical protein
MMRARELHGLQQRHVPDVEAGRVDGIPPSIRAGTHFRLHKPGLGIHGKIAHREGIRGRRIPSNIFVVCVIRVAIAGGGRSSRAEVANRSNRRGSQADARRVNDGPVACSIAVGKLSFLAGRWSGPATIRRGPGEALHLIQTEDVEFKLDGLVLLIEGKSNGAEGKVMFSAFATISYDDSSLTYRFRAYNDGHYVDSELSVPPNGFSWSFTTGPALAGICCEQHALDRERRVGRSHRSDRWQQSWASHRRDVTATFAVGERSSVSKSSERNASTGRVTRSEEG